MKAEITEKGVYDAEGNKIAVGEEITVEGNTMPAWLSGKAVEVKERKKAAVTNPAKGAVQQDAPQTSASTKA